MTNIILHIKHANEYISSFAFFVLFIFFNDIRSIVLALRSTDPLITSSSEVKKVNFILSLLAEEIDALNSLKSDLEQKTAQCCPQRPKVTKDPLVSAYVPTTCVCIYVRVLICAYRSPHAFPNGWSQSYEIRNV